MRCSWESVLGTNMHTLNIEKRLKVWRQSIGNTTFNVPDLCGLSATNNIDLTEVFGDYTTISHFLLIVLNDIWICYWSLCLIKETPNAW